MRLGIFRAEAEARRTKLRLEALGHTVVEAPVIEIRPTVPSGFGEQADVIVFSSQHAPEVIGVRGVDSRTLARPCFCVGTRTAEAARAAGFQDVRNVAGNASALATAVLRETRPSDRIAYVTGRDRKATFEDMFAWHGRPLVVVVAYEAQPMSFWPPTTARALTTCEAALDYSARSALLAKACAEASGVLPWWLGTTHYCLSSEIAACVRSAGASRTVHAAQPDEDTLLAAVQSGALQ